MLNKYFLPLTAAGFLALAISPAQAFNFTTGPLGGTCANLPSFPPLLSPGDPGTTSCTTGDGFTISTNDGYLQTKTVNGVTGVGISGGSKDVVPAEINYPELLDLDLPSPGVLASLDLGFLYQPGVFGDEVYEVAAATPDGGMKGTLTVTGDTTAIWSLGSTVVNLSASTNDGGGWYSVENPFGNKVITGLKLKQLPGVDQNGNVITTLPRNNPANSDFALVGAKKAPEPTTFAGLALVGAVLMASRRRRVHKAS